MNQYCWFGDDNFCIYDNPSYCNPSKLKNITDIKNVLILFFDDRVVECFLYDTFFSDTFFNDI